MDTLRPVLTVTVRIAEEDIEQGHIAKCRSCPAALAANRATGFFCDVGGVHLIAYDNRQYIENGNLLVGRLPDEARVWIVRFDAQRSGIVNDPPGPFRFPLRLYRVADFTKPTGQTQVRAMLADAAESYLSIAQIVEVDPNPAVVGLAGRNRHFKWRFRQEHGAGPTLADVYRQAARAGADYVSHRPGDLRRLPDKYRAA